MTITKTIEKSRPNGDFLVITAELRLDHSTLSDGFAITADLWEKRGNRSGKSRWKAGREQDAGGCMHDEILRAAPSLRPLVTVHCADPDGTPMHAVANGWYFYSGKASQHDKPWDNPEGLSDLARGARALSIPAEDLPADMDHDAFVAFAESLRPHWAEQAKVARELLESL
jgi:hypothetical protein